jgi:hypothetical protein
VLARFVEDPLRGTAVHDLGDRAAWVQPLIDWATTAPGVEPAHRSSYLAWHCAGRQILRVKRSRAGIDVTAGVNYTNPAPDQPPPYSVTVTSPLEAAVVHRAVARAANAAADRLAGVDTGHAEHRFQALLPSLRDAFGLKELRREIPARRAGSGPAFIDFVGIDRRRRLHIVETKLGNDEMLALQALDYWIWASANKTALATWLFEVADPTGVVIDVVAASKQGTDKTVGPYTAAQLEAFDGQINWRLHELTDWETAPSVTTAGSRALRADTPRCVRPRWSVRLHQHLVAQAAASGHELTQDHRWQSASAGFTPAALEVFEDLTAKRLAHAYASHVRSSQAFALNLFAGLDDDALVSLCRSVGIPAESAGPIKFEYGDHDGLLGEASKSSPHTTQVDVAIPVVLHDGTTQLLFVEVKLTETDFGTCSAFRSAHNSRRDVCATPLPFGGAPSRCFQLSNHDRGGRRKYDEFLGPLSESPSGSACWFRDGMNQPMRNVALAAATASFGEPTRVTFVLCAPRGSYRDLAALARSTAFVQQPSHRVARRPSGGTRRRTPLRSRHACALADRYLLDRALTIHHHDRLAWQAKLDAWFPDGAALEVSDDGEDPWYPHVDPRRLVLAATSSSCVVEVSSAEAWHPFQPCVASFDESAANDDAAHDTYVVLSEPPNSRRLVQARRAMIDVRRLIDLRDLRDPRSVDDRDAESWLRAWLRIRGRITPEAPLR